jgi:hypothetical protein
MPYLIFITPRYKRDVRPSLASLNVIAKLIPKRPCPMDVYAEPDLGKIILKVISDLIKIIFSKKDLKSDQDHIFYFLFL